MPCNSQFVHMLPTLQAHFDALEKRRQDFLTALERCTPEQRSFQPEAGEWSLGEVAHHLLLVEQGVLGVLADGGRAPTGRRRIRDWIGSAAVRLVFALGIRVKVPVRGVRPKAGVPLEEVRRQWDDTRAALVVYLESITESALRKPVLRHPISGPMDVLQGLVFLGRHFDHHLRQARRIRRAAAFPR